MLKDNWEEKHGTHVGNMMLQPLQGFSDKQPSSIDPVNFRHPFDNQFHHQNHVSETRPTFIPKPVDNACSQTEAHKSLPPMKASRTDAEKPTVGSNMQELIKFLSANYGPMKTPLEVGTPEYLRLVEILQQSGSDSKVGGTNNTPSVGMASLAPSSITEQKEISRDDQGKLPENGQKNDSVVGHPKTDEKKLWEGSLQLSSSVTLSATAFFKSGEKLVGNSWPESIEVKGKVRLEAFEKYVKDLPRSRNRGLMVISVCWKEGSSNTGLTGMKEVAKGYKKSSRVGFAQLVSGIDLYICPRSDPIITILAKYGFFKGMGVLDDNQDSMIGCVVWRKNRPLNPIKNTPDNKSSPNPIQPPNSSPSLSIKQSEEPLTLPLTSNNESNKNMSLSAADVDHNGATSCSNSTSDSCNLVQKRAFQDDDDLPEFDFGARVAAVNCQKMDKSQLTQLTNTVIKNTGDGSLEQASKKTKLFYDNDDDMPEWCPPIPTVHRQVPPQTTTSNFHNLPLCPPWPPPVPIPPPPRADSRPSFSYQPFRPAISSPPPTFMGPPLPPPPPLPLPPPPPPPPQSQPGRFSSNQGMWHRPGLSNGNRLFASSNRRPPQP